MAYRIYSEYAGVRLEQDLKRLEADMKKTLPRKINDITTLEDVKYERSKTIYWLVIDTEGRTFDPGALEQSARDSICANTELVRAMKEKGFTYEYHYVSKDRKPVAGFTVSKCSETSRNAI